MALAVASRNNFERWRVVASVLGKEVEQRWAVLMSGELRGDWEELERGRLLGCVGGGSLLFYGADSTGAFVACCNGY